jgi:TPR repeat protein
VAVKLRRSCELGLGLGCFELSNLYGQTEAVTQDEAKAAVKRACELGFAQACGQ